MPEKVSECGRKRQNTCSENTEGWRREKALAKVLFRELGLARGMLWPFLKCAPIPHILLMKSTMWCALPNEARVVRLQVSDTTVKPQFATLSPELFPDVSSVLSVSVAVCILLYAWWCKLQENSTVIHLALEISLCLQNSSRGEVLRKASWPWQAIISTWYLILTFDSWLCFLCNKKYTLIQCEICITFIRQYFYLIIRVSYLMTGE